MIDIHSHILPGFDDGAKNEEDFLKMARMAVDDGITCMVATPHHRNHSYMSSKTTIMANVGEVNQLLELHHIPLKILPGQEIYVYDQLLEDVNNDEILCLNDTSKYMLLELPMSIPKYIDHVIYDLLLEGIIPIVPHPERNVTIMSDPNSLYQLVRMGALVQMNATSLTGTYGKRIKNVCYQLLEHHLVHFIATDAHDTKRRIPRLSNAYKRLEKFGGKSYADQMKENAEKVIRGERIIVEEPIRIQKKKVFGVF